MRQQLSTITVIAVVVAAGMSVTALAAWWTSRPTTQPAPAPTPAATAVPKGAKAKVYLRRDLAGLAAATATEIDRNPGCTTITGLVEDVDADWIVLKPDGIARDELTFIPRSSVLWMSIDP